MCCIHVIWNLGGVRVSQFPESSLAPLCLVLGFRCPCGISSDQPFSERFSLNAELWVFVAISATTGRPQRPTSAPQQNQAAVYALQDMQGLSSTRKASTGFCRSGPRLAVHPGLAVTTEDSAQMA